MDDFNLARGDIEKLSSWGLFNNKIVLIDYGTTSSISPIYFKQSSHINFIA